MYTFCNWIHIGSKSQIADGCNTITSFCFMHQKNQKQMVSKIIKRAEGNGKEEIYKI